MKQLLELIVNLDLNELELLISRARNSSQRKLSEIPQYIKVILDNLEEQIPEVIDDPNDAKKITALIQKLPNDSKYNNQELILKLDLILKLNLAGIPQSLKNTLSLLRTAIVIKTGGIVCEDFLDSVTQLNKNSDEKERLNLLGQFITNLTLFTTDSEGQPLDNLRLITILRSILPNKLTKFKSYAHLNILKMLQDLFALQPSTELLWHFERLFLIRYNVAQTINTVYVQNIGDVRRALKDSKGDDLEGFKKELKKFGAGYASSCDVVQMSSVPTKASLNDLPIKSNAAYIRCGNKLIYINKANKIILDLPGVDLALFDRQIEPSLDVRVLTPEMLEKIESITRHVAATNIQPNKVDALLDRCRSVGAELQSYTDFPRLLELSDDDYRKILKVEATIDHDKMSPDDRLNIKLGFNLFKILFGEEKINDRIDAKAKKEAKAKAELEAKEKAALSVSLPRLRLRSDTNRTPVDLTLKITDALDILKDLDLHKLKIYTDPKAPISEDDSVQLIELQKLFKELRISSRISMVQALIDELFPFKEKYEYKADMVSKLNYIRTIFSIRDAFKKNIDFDFLHSFDEFRNALSDRLPKPVSVSRPKRTSIIIPIIPSESPTPTVNLANEEDKITSPIKTERPVLDRLSEEEPSVELVPRRVEPGQLPPLSSVMSMHVSNETLSAISKKIQDYSLKLAEDVQKFERQIKEEYKRGVNSNSDALHNDPNYFTYLERVKSTTESSIVRRKEFQLLSKMKEILEDRQTSNPDKMFSLSNLLQIHDFKNDPQQDIVRVNIWKALESDFPNFGIYIRLYEFTHALKNKDMYSAIRCARELGEYLTSNLSEDMLAVKHFSVPVDSVDIFMGLQNLCKEITHISDNATVVAIQRGITYFDAIAQDSLMLEAANIQVDNSVQNEYTQLALTAIHDQELHAAKLDQAYAATLVCKNHLAQQIREQLTNLKFDLTDCKINIGTEAEPEYLFIPVQDVALLVSTGADNSLSHLDNDDVINNEKIKPQLAARIESLQTIVAREPKLKMTIEKYQIVNQLAGTLEKNAEYPVSDNQPVFVNAKTRLDNFEKKYSEKAEILAKDADGIVGFFMKKIRNILGIKTKEERLLTKLGMFKSKPNSLRLPQPAPVNLRQEP